MSKHQTCIQCHCDFVGPDLNIGENMCDNCYTQAHFDCTEEITRLQAENDRLQKELISEQKKVFALETSLLD